MAGIPPTLIDLARRQQAAAFNRLRKDVPYRMSSGGTSSVAPETKVTSEEQAPEGFAFVGMPPENAKLSFEDSSYIFPN
mgnify:FL=1